MKLCVLVEEGGIGVRDISEVQSSLFMKFGWNILTQKSIWANFFWAKYVKNGHIVQCLDKKGGSRFWNKVVEGLKKILQNSKWKVKEGNISLWFDNFLSIGPLFELGIEVEEPNTILNEMVVNDRWVDDRIKNLMGRQAASEVIELIGNLKIQRIS